MQVKETWVLNWASLVMVFAFSMPAQAVPGDMDGDGDVDLGDYARFRACITGPDASAVLPDCVSALFDADKDVDMGDIAGFLAAFTAGGPCGSPLAHDCCDTPIAVGDGTRAYTNVGATTDGPDEPTMCNFSGSTNVDADIWYCYTASCTGTAFVSLCGSDYDTKLAVYAGCGCPTTAPLACSDDDCGTGTGIVQSRVEISVTQGQPYMVRVGGYSEDQGDGRLTIGCNVDACANGSGDCTTPSPTGAPGCGDATCCAATCILDPFCCDVTWDEVCAGEAQSICKGGGGFAACAEGAGSCGVPDTTPGCGVDCCNKVCETNSYCCLTEWDTICVEKAESMCFLTCGPPAGDRDCGSPHLTLPGCNNEACCQAVCSEDLFCCDTAWDQMCVDGANSMCFLTCGPPAGDRDCGSPHPTLPGCNNEACCQAVCTDDPWCCDTEWDATCVEEAAASTSCP